MQKFLTGRDQLFKPINFDSMRSFYLGLFLLFGLLLVEVSCQLLWMQVFPPGLISWLYFFSGLGIGSVMFWTPSFLKVNFTIQHYSSIFFFLLLLMVLYIFRHSEFTIHRNPLNYQVADMLPVIKIMGERCLNGHQIYSIIPEIWGGMQPIYLPAMWLSYLPAVALQVDLRWISLIVMGLGLILPCFFIPQRSKVSFWLILYLVPSFMALDHLLTVDSVFFSASEEAVVVFYYLLLGASLLTRRYTLQAFFITLCLLSRFSLLGWVPVYLVYIYMHAGWPVLRRVLVVLLSTCLGLMTLTGAIFHLDIWLGIQKNYLAALMAQPWKYRELIDVNLGLAKLWQYEALPIMHYLSVVLCLFILPLVFIYFLIRKFSFTAHPLFILGALKIILVVFYNLLIMPYGYLFYTSTFLSVIIFIAYTANLTPTSSTANNN